MTSEFYTNWPTFNCKIIQQTVTQTPTQEVTTKDSKAGAAVVDQRKQRRWCDGVIVCVTVVQGEVHHVNVSTNGDDDGSRTITCQSAALESNRQSAASFAESANPGAPDFEAPSASNVNTTLAFDFNLKRCR